MSSGVVLPEDCMIDHLAGWLSDLEHRFYFGFFWLEHGVTLSLSMSISTGAFEDYFQGYCIWAAVVMCFMLALPERALSFLFSTIIINFHLVVSLPA